MLDAAGRGVARRAACASPVGGTWPAAWWSGMVVRNGGRLAACAGWMRATPTGV